MALCCFGKKDDEVDTYDAADPFDLQLKHWLDDLLHPFPKRTYTVELQNGAWQHKKTKSALDGLHVQPFEDAPECRTMFQTMKRGWEQHTTEELYGQRDAGKTEYSWVTYDEFYRLSEFFAEGILRQLTFLRVGEAKVGILGNRKTGFMICLYGCWCRNLCAVPMYDGVSNRILAQVLDHADMELVCVTPKNYSRVHEVVISQGNKATLKAIVAIPGTRDEITDLKWTPELPPRLKEELLVFTLGRIIEAGKPAEYQSQSALLPIEEREHRRPSKRETGEENEEDLDAGLTSLRTLASGKTRGLSRASSSQRQGFASAPSATSSQGSRRRERSKTFLGKKNKKKLGKDIKALLEIPLPKVLESHRPEPDSFASILYTCGTTGDPKGALITQEATLGAGVGLLATFQHDIKADDVYFCGVQFPHGYQNSVEVAMMASGCQIAFYSGKLENLIIEAQRVRPSVMSGPPVLWEFLEFEVKNKFMRASNHVQIRQALRAQTKLTRTGVPRRVDWAEKKVFAEVRQMLGGICRMFYTGDGALKPATMHFLKVVFGVSFPMGYALTEVAGCGASVMVTDPTLAQDGVPFPDVVEWKIKPVKELSKLIEQNEEKEDKRPIGEVCFRGPIVMKGYYKDDELTKQVLDRDKWFHTGDIGAMNPCGSISILGRLEEMIKLRTGDIVSLSKVESVYRSAALVGQIFVYGNEFETALVAIVVPDPDQLLPFAINEKGRTCVEYGEEGWQDAFVELCREKTVKQWILDEMHMVGEKAELGENEIIAAIHLEYNINDKHQGFQVDNSLLTPTYKMRRENIRSKYQDVLNSLYDDLTTIEGVEVHRDTLGDAPTLRV